jgi:hypothetical protein
MNGQIQYGSTSTLTTELTVVTPGDRRLEQFRAAVRQVADRPVRADLDALVQLATTLGLESGQIAAELLLIEAWREGIELSERVARGELPVVPAEVPTPGRTPCHFTSAARFGRRRSDQCGHLMFTTLAIEFLGALDVSIQWSEVAHVSRAGREIVITLHDSQRGLRFLCSTVSEAVRAYVLAHYLSSVQVHG